MKQLIILCTIFIIYSNAAVMPEGEFIKQKNELIQLKKDLDQFYKAKENEYKKNKQKLDAINQDIQNRLKDIQATKDANQKILAEIKQTIVSKAMKLYGKMKPKLVKKILQKKIDDGEINDVFDIIVRLKDKKVMKLLKMFDTDTSTQLMDMMEKYKNKSKKGK